MKELELPEKVPLLNSKTPLRRAGTSAHNEIPGNTHRWTHTPPHTPPQEPREKINYQNSRGREMELGRGAPKVDVL